MALTGEAKKAYQRDLMRRRREAKSKEDSELSVADEMLTDEPHPVYPWLKRYADREYDAAGLVLKKQRCELCDGVWSASIEIECPYCHGHGKKKEAA
jgi:hypothetical protein